LGPGFPYIPRVIDTDAKLEALLPGLEAATWVAVDTEADSLHAYPEKLCLIQIGTGGSHDLLDPLSGINLAPVWRILSRHELIVHGADYDLRLLKKSAGFVPGAIFDTMLAGRLLGCREFGLTRLVSKFLGVQLEKGPQKANWARRPLTERMEEYALNDIRYLQPLASLFREQLREKGRLEWHQAMCARLIADATLIQPPDPDAVWRVKGSHLLGPPALAVLREIWHWRERESLAANRPPYFLLPPQTMVALAATAVHAGNLLALLPRRMSPRRQAGVLEAIQRGLEIKNPPAIPRKRGQRPTEQEKRRCQELERRRDDQARKLNIDPTLIASRATLMALASDWERAKAELMSWQEELLL
jgi:ribonuclease D